MDNLTKLIEQVKYEIKHTQSKYRKRDLLKFLSRLEKKEKERLRKNRKERERLTDVE